MENEFEMTHLELMRYFGIEVEQCKDDILVSHSKYENKVVKIFNIVNSKFSPTLIITSLKWSKYDDGSKVDPTIFKRLVGILMYLTMTRPDIMYGVSLISRFMESLSPKDSL